MRRGNKRLYDRQINFLKRFSISKKFKSKNLPKTLKQNIICKIHSTET